MRVVLSIPTGGAVLPLCVSTQRFSLLVAANHGTEFVSEISPDRLAYCDARNMVATYAYENRDKVDGILWIDSDMIPEANSVWRLMKTAEDKGFDIFSGTYHQRRPPYEGVFFTYIPEKDIFKRCQTYEPNTIYKTDGCGFGFCFTSTKALVDIYNGPLFNWEGGRWFPDSRYSDGFGEDMGFCRQAWEIKLPVYVDTGLQIGHCGEPQICTLDTQTEYRKRLGGLAPVESVGT